MADLPVKQIKDLDLLVSPAATDKVPVQDAAGKTWYATVSGVGSGGSGDMTAAVYDPTSVADDAFDVDNHTSGSTNKVFTGTEQTKLSGIETAADVTDTANVTSAGALMDSEVDADIKTLALPASTTISAFGASLIDDAAASNARTTLGVDAAGTDNSDDNAVNTLYSGLVSNATHTGDVTGATALTIAAKAVDVAMLADGTDGELITWSATGVAATVGVGTSTHVLTSNGPGVAPTFQAASGGAPEGTAVVSTGVSVGWVLQADGDDTSSWVALSGGGDALTANPLSQFAATTSAQLAGVISDETGSGALVFGTSPTFVTPVLGTPASGVATNLTGTAASLTAGNVTTNANLTGHITSTGNAAVLGSFTAAQLSSALSDSTYSGNNTGDEASASLTVAGIIEVATIAETNTGTDATRAVSPDGLDGWTGSAQVVTLGTVTTGDVSAIVTESFMIAIGDETTAATTGTAKTTFRMPYAFTLTDIRASCVTAPTGATLTIDVNETASTILSTKITIDATEKTSETAATAPVLSDTALADDAEITIDIDQIGSTIAGAGIKVTLIGHQ